jgi:ABC-2 type transport system ATP-binding protein
MSNTILEVEGLVKKFHQRAVLQQVDFDVRRGEVLGLIGPNGSGKTTLFECVAGLMPAAAGVVRFQNSLLPLPRRKRHIFYLPDGIIPWAEHSVSSVVSFFRRLYRSSNDDLIQFKESLRLDELWQARVGTLSKGERKRTMLAAALLTNHDLLLLDEPFDGLDLRQTRDVMNLLRQHAARGRTLMLSIHQLIDAGRVCDRLVLLSDGKVVGQGTLEELQTNANLPGASIEEIFIALT